MLVVHPCFDIDYMTMMFTLLSELDFDGHKQPSLLCSACSPYLGTELHSSKAIRLLTNVSGDVAVQYLCVQLKLLYRHQHCKPHQLDYRTSE